MAQDRELADRRAALAAIVSAGVMIAQQVGSKATRDALFLSSFDAEDLPRVVIAAAAASMLAVLAASRAYARFEPARVVPAAFFVSALLYLVEWLVAPTAPKVVAVALYMHTAVFGALVISGFWSVVNERFDPHTAKKVVGRIGAGSTFGGVLGGLLAERVGAWLEADAMLVALAALNAVAAFGVSRMGLAEPLAPAALVEPSDNPLTVLRKTPYLRSLAVLVVLTAMSAGLLDYAFKAEAAAHFDGNSGALLSFFAMFHVVAAILSFVLQAGLAKPALEKLGVAGSVATLPIIVLLTASVAAGLGRLATVVVARAAELVVANSIFRSGYELLYTPVAPEKKRPTKALIDVAGNRIGDALGSVMVLVVLAVLPASATALVVALAAAVALLSLWVARRLHRGYVGQLEESLRSGTPADAAFREAATLQSLSTLGLDREALFEQLSAHQSWGDRVSTPLLTMDGHGPLMPKVPEGIDAPDDDPIHAKGRALRTGDVDAIRAVLRAHPLDPRLAGYVIALLARREVYQDAVRALRDIASEIVAPLTRALTDPDQPFAIRRRLPRVLEVCDSDEAATGLMTGLKDDLFEVRYRSAIALSRLAARSPDRSPSLELVHERVTHELKQGRRVWDSRRLLDADETDDSPLLDRRHRDRLHRSVEHVFTLLSLAYDPEPLKLSLFALASEDKVLRGTALEYLENVLPEGIRGALFPMLDVRVEIRKKRSRQEIEHELFRSMQDMNKADIERAIARPTETE